MSQPARTRVRVAHAIIGAAVLACLVIAAISYCFDWHETRSSDWGGGLSCAFMPDCEPSPPTLGEPTRDSGLDHGGPSIVLLLGITAALAIAAIGLPGRLAGLLCCCLLPAAAIASFLAAASATFLAHMFDRSQGLPAEGVFFLASLVSIGGAVAMVVLQAILFARARRARRAAATEATARGDQR